MKKYLLLLVVAMLANIGRAAVGDTFEYDGLNYTILSEENDEVEVARNSYASGDIVIPSLVNYDGKIYGVHSIAEEAFYSTSVTSVSIPGAVTSIGASAFDQAYSLSSITIPNSVTSIGEYAFSECAKLTSITLPESLTSIEVGVFRHCRGLTSIKIPASVTSIGRDAFRYCTLLTSITIPDAVTAIGTCAFSDCSDLVEFNVEKNNRYFSSADGVLYDFDKTTLLQWPGGKTEYFIPDFVTTIGDFAFHGCTDMTHITIPDSVTTICDYAFRRCIGLTSIIIPDSVTFIGSNAFGECEELTSVILSNSLTSIGEYAFDCTALTAITIPNSVTSIENGAFMYCPGLTSVTIPNSVISIGGSAFEYCSGLTNVVIGKSVAKIGEQAFRRCSNLAKVVNLNSTPQELVYDEFDGIADDAVLYVPAGSVDAYKAAAGWSVFSDIRGMGAFEVALSAETLEIAEGEYVTIDAKIMKDDDVTVESEEWSSSDPAVAVVKDGVVTAVAPGKAVITYTAVDSYGAPHMESCVVTVTEGQNSIGAIGDDADATVDVYTLQGVAVLHNAPATALRTLPAGLYIIRTGNATRKIAVK